MGITISLSLEAITIEDIRKFEGERNVQLPIEYQNFLLETNGGIPALGAFRYYDNDTELWNGNYITQFFGLNKISNTHSSKRIESLGDNIADGMFPIARTSTADFVCIKVTGDNIGEIHLWRHSYLDTVRIAENFDVFINNLFLPEDPDYDEEDY